MNLSGLAAAHLCGYYKILPENLVVLHDELDLPLGRIRVKRGGGNAGHQGLNSITRELGTPDFVRIRLGIGRPAPGRDVKAYVLERFSEAERTVAEDIATDAAGLVETLLAQGIEAACRESGRIDRRPAGTTPKRPYAVQSDMDSFRPVRYREKTLTQPLFFPARKGASRCFPLTSCRLSAQGVGKVERIESRDIAGTTTDFFIVRILSNNVTLMVRSPRRQRGPAALCSESRAWPSSNPQGPLGLHRLHRAELEPPLPGVFEKLKSGDLADVAYVLKELLLIGQNKELSFGERRLLEQATNLLTLELALALGREQDDVKAVINELFADVIQPKASE
jgi:CarD family transcriptional regulator